MKRFLLIMSCTLFCLLKLHAQENKVALTVHITGLKNNNGKVFIALYDSEKNYLKNETGTSVSIKNKRAVAIFDAIDAGSYAISFFHDENNNQEMDTNFLGIPKESYGFSNNAKGFMGPPTFKNAKVLVDKDTSIYITSN